MSLFNLGDKKAMDCAAEVGQDGITHFSCKRQKVLKNGERVNDGQVVEAFIDPQGCSPVVTRGIVDDNERGIFDEQLKRLASGCRRKINTPGLSKG